jgi:anti-sigma B factor antagonist
MAASVQTNAPNDSGLRVVLSQIGATTTIGLEGEWDLATQISARHAVGRALACRPECLVLDLSRVSFIDASAVHAVISLARRTERLDVRFLIVPGPNAVQRIFEILHLVDRLPFTSRETR